MDGGATNVFISFISQKCMVSSTYGIALSGASLMKMVLKIGRKTKDNPGFLTVEDYVNQLNPVRNFL